MRKDEVITNQLKILANQDQIKQNQNKLDLLLASQETILANQEQIRELEAKLSQLLAEEERLTDEYDPFGEMIGTSDEFQRVLRESLNVAETDTTVLLRGETGTGKELLAHAIHSHSPRKHRPFIIVNCAALPSSLIESELFGYEKGAFTGASQRKAGRFELADGGTIFLDEIGEVPLETQGRFLRVIQTGIFERLGSTKSVRVKVRIIAATNQPLERLVSLRKFRADLYYRLNIFPITLPPLRERTSDIPLLVRHFVKKYSVRFNRVINSIHEQSLLALHDYHWPGNIRELENMIERSILTAETDLLKIKLPDTNLEPAISINDELNGSVISHSTYVSSQNNSLRPFQAITLAENERALIQRTLDHTGGRISGPHGAAEILGLPASTLRSRIKKLGLKIPSHSSNA
ncbi:MAG: sigma 54-interacting transcriptional regulator [Acidobacteria bacterium]|nr:sigma 54-interacting transcriptional regulator [Acidobacteriota bacterium]